MVEERNTLVRDEFQIQLAEHELGLFKEVRRLKEQLAHVHYAWITGQPPPPPHHCLYEVLLLYQYPPKLHFLGQLIPFTLQLLAQHIIFLLFWVFPLYKLQLYLSEVLLLSCPLLPLSQVHNHFHTWVY